MRKKTIRRVKYFILKKMVNILYFQKLIQFNKGFSLEQQNCCDAVVLNYKA